MHLKRRSGNLGLIRLLFGLIVATDASLAGAFPTQDEESLGVQALHYRKRSAFWLRADAAAVDAKTTTFPPGSSYIDRRLELFTNLGADISIDGGRLGVRPNIKAMSSLRKAQEDTPPQSPKITELLELRPSLDLTLVTSKGLEVIGGLLAHAIPRQTSQVETELVSSESSYGRLAYFTYRFGLVKRSGSWSGGFYYTAANGSTRTFTQTASDGSGSSGSDSVQTPGEYGIVAEFSTSGVEYLLDLASVQAGEGGERTAQGAAVRDAYLRGTLSAYFALGAGLGLRSVLQHQTLSYSNNAYVSVDTIPVSSIKTLLVFGDPVSHGFLGLSYARGSDGTSITEYNAKFLLQVLALSIGFNYAI